ncbi:hypothetical protein D3C73_1439410 [compost metagenome]
MGDFPRQVQQIGRADKTQHAVKHRVRLEHRAQAKPDRQHQAEEAAGNAEHVRNRAVKPEIDPRGQQHRVIRARGNRRYQGEQGKAQQ